MKKILVVEDHPDVGESLAALLRLWNYEVQLARSAEDGLKALLEYRPDIIFHDIGLPGMDGYAAARTIRSRPELGGVFLVALTGFGRHADRLRAREAGFDLHITKPATTDEFAAALEQAAQRPQRTRRSLSRHGRHPPTPADPLKHA